MKGTPRTLPPDSLDISAYTIDGAAIGVLNATEDNTSTFRINLSTGSYILLASATWIPSSADEYVTGYVIYKFLANVTDNWESRVFKVSNKYDIASTQGNESLSDSLILWISLSAYSSGLMSTVLTFIEDKKMLSDITVQLVKYAWHFARKNEENSRTQLMKICDSKWSNNEMTIRVDINV